MKRIIIAFTALIALITLASCKKEKDGIEIIDIEPGRNSVYVELKVKNKHETLEPETIEGAVYLDGTKVTTKKVDLDDEEEVVKYTLNITGLLVDKTYNLEISVLENKVRKVMAKKTFKTSSRGGTKDDPKLIYTISDFLDMEKDDTAYYRLEEDLDFTDYEFKSLFNTASRQFNGNLDGNDKTIKNVTISERTTYSGIIGRNSGTIKNLNVENVVVDFTKTSTYSQYTSLFVGRNIGTIENVKVSGQMDLEFSQITEVNVGGIAAVVESSGKVLNSEVDLTVNTTITARTTFNIGGIVGKLREGTIEEVKVVFKANVENAENINIGGAFGRVELDSNKVKANKVKVDSTIELTTKVNNVNTQKTTFLAVGGFAGRTSESSFENVFVETNITINEPLHTKPKDVTYTGIYVGGLIGISNNLNLKEAVVSGEISILEVDNENYNLQLDNLYMGGLIGDSSNGIFNNVLNNGLTINVLDVFKNGNVSLLIAKENNTKINNYGFINSKILYNEITYNGTISFNNDVNYKVTYDSSNGDDLITVFEQSHKMLSAPKAPKKEDYTFIGWYHNGAFYNFDQVLTSNLDLVAYYKPKGVKFYVGFDLGYETTEEIDPILLDSEETITPIIPEREGYEFLGWYYNGTKHEEDYIVSSNLVYLAKWEKDDASESITVNFELGFESDDSQVLITEKGTKLTIPITNPEREGYQFMGWYKDGVLFDEETSITEDTTIVARWLKVSSSLLEELTNDLNEWFNSDWIIDNLEG